MVLVVFTIPVFLPHSVCPGMNLAGMEHLSKDNVDLFSGCTAIDGHFAITALTSEAILRG